MEQLLVGFEPIKIRKWKTVSDFYESCWLLKEGREQSNLTAVKAQKLNWIFPSNSTNLISIKIFTKFQN